MFTTQTIDALLEKRHRICGEILGGCVMAIRKPRGTQDFCQSK